MRGKLFATLRILVGLVFVASGFMKLMQPYQNFLVVIQSYEILQGPVTVILAKTIPWVEFLAGVFLIMGLWSRLATLVLWFLNSIFIAMLSSAILNKIPIGECGCFGDSFSLTPTQMLAFDSALWFVFLCLYVFSYHARYFSLDRYFDN